jgi:hypothetical membrane protein
LEAAMNDLSTEAKSADGFNTAAAVTRSLLGWGVVVGPFYLAIGLVLALTRSGFDLAEHQLSLLMLGDSGWMQSTNLIVSGLMVLAAALGFHRALGGSAAAVLLGVVGLGLVGSGIFPPDPMGGFPPGEPEVATASGIMHLVFGLVQFLSMAATAFVMARWFKRRGQVGVGRYSRITGFVVIVGFLGGAAVPTTVGVALLWLVVLAEWVWLAVASVYVYRTVPHPDTGVVAG